MRLQGLEVNQMHTSMPASAYHNKFLEAIEMLLDLTQIYT